MMLSIVASAVRLQATSLSSSLTVELIVSIRFRDMYDLPAPDLSNGYALQNAGPQETRLSSRTSIHRIDKVVRDERLLCPVFYVSVPSCAGETEYAAHRSTVHRT